MAAGVAMSIAAGTASASARFAGSDAPEKTEVRVGFMPLSDCASVVAASVFGFDRKHGIRIVLDRATSWAAVRDRLIAGDIDAAHALYGLIYGAHLGMGGLRADMAVLMTLNRNGQGIALSRALASASRVDREAFALIARRRQAPLTLAHTFPTGTHAMWLYSWLASAGIDPTHDVATVTVPPPQMLANLRAATIDGFSVGEPWNHRAIQDGLAVQMAASQHVWKDHPEKVLGTTASFVRRYPNTARALTMAVLDASRFVDSSNDHKARIAEVLAQTAYVDAPVSAILPRLVGDYEDGLGRRWRDADHVKFFDGGAVNFPYLSDGMWFLTQYVRWGLLDAHPDYVATARSINRIDTYRDAATALRIDVPVSPLRTSRLADGGVWDGTDPAAYADRFAVRATPASPATPAPAARRSALVPPFDLSKES
jgi:nitrate/nitrite transport system substrate-binding protein